MLAAKLVVMPMAIPHVAMSEGTPTTTPDMTMLVATLIVMPTTTSTVTTMSMATLYSYDHGYAHKQLLRRLVHQKGDITHYKYFLP
jgi:hypothetical protein